VPRSRLYLALAAIVMILGAPQRLPLGACGLGAGCAVEVANLKQQLESDLRARRPVEFAFIAQVVLMVERDQLPLPLVRSTFHWARSQHPYPFQYFSRGLILRARRVGIEIPTPEGL
jgi:hypothetical protein